MKRLKAKRRTIDGLFHVRVKDVENADDRYLGTTVLLGSLDDFNSGVVVNDWNRWVCNRRPVVTCDKVNVRLGQLSHSGVFAAQYQMAPIDDPSELQKSQLARRQLIGSMVEEARRDRRHRFLTSARIAKPSVLEKRIVSTLYRQSCTANQLCQKIACSRRALFEKQGLTMLRAAHLVQNDRQMGGFFLPEFPPLGLEWLVSEVVPESGQPDSVT